MRWAWKWSARRAAWLEGAISVARRFEHQDALRGHPRGARERRHHLHRRVHPLEGDALGLGGGALGAPLAVVPEQVAEGGHRDHEAREGERLERGQERGGVAPQALPAGRDGGGTARFQPHGKSAGDRASRGRTPR